MDEPIAKFFTTSPAVQIYLPGQPLGHPVPAGNEERARAARRRVYAEDARRAAARALDTYISAVYAHSPYPDEDAPIRAAGERFIEQVGDYVLSRLHHSGHYGVPPCTCMPPDGWTVTDLDGSRSMMHSPLCAAHPNPDYGVSEAENVWCHCQGSTPTRLHAVGAPGCKAGPAPGSVEMPLGEIAVELPRVEGP